MRDYILGLIDRLVTNWFAYRAGKSSIINEALEKRVKDLKVKNEVHNRVDTDPEYVKLLDEEFKRK